MKVTKENIKDIKYFKIFDKQYSLDIAYDQNLLQSLLLDLEELNQLLEDNGKSYKKLYIDYINEHTEYSSERTDPCPDYYGLFMLRFEKNDYECIGCEMTLDELDLVLCTLINFIEFKIE